MIIGVLPSTVRLELDDAAVREWDAVVLAAVDREVVLDRSAFFPGGGGQPADFGQLTWPGGTARVVGTRRSDEHYLRLADADPLPPEGVTVACALDWPRRFALMRTHSALHVAAGVVYREFGAMVTGGNMEPLVGRLDFDLPEVPLTFRERLQAQLDDEVTADRPIVVRTLTREEAARTHGLVRTVVNNVVPGLDRVRVVDIVGLDAQADGGTHVASTGAIGKVRVVKVDNKGKANRRLRLALDA